MILPTAEDVLSSIEATLDSVIRPVLTGTAERSAAATLSHLIRHTRLRLAEEGQILLDDIARLRTLLPRIGAYFVQAEPETSAVIDAALKQTPDFPTGAYPVLAKLGAQAIILREALTISLIRLQAQPAELQAAEYTELRDAIKSYLAWQINKEGELIDPAFAGHGPRR